MRQVVAPEHEVGSETDDPASPFERFLETPLLAIHHRQIVQRLVR